ncbi:MmgE/PrpD family protein [Euzebya pacifica]|uniref:MmgE/PrpD family protein n=1 Tax=Euzebya pacifica TaxID=1608957 RepID=UPI000DF7DFFB|nr:MmgE/PrpD family protein [Euzebya pacifica]
MALRDAIACMAGGAATPLRHSPPSLGSDPGHLARWLATVGHVLDFDDTFTPGLAHLSSPTAAAALAMASHLDGDVAVVAQGHRRGWEFMAAMTRAHHPALYDLGWHPTAVCGAPAAAVAAGTVLGLDGEDLTQAVRLAALGTGGLQAAFGSDGKSLQVGLAAQTGVTAAHLARKGTDLGDRVDYEWGRAHGSESAAEPMRLDAVVDNWIKAYACCLQTHTSIEAAWEATRSGATAGAPVKVTVHPLSRRAAPLDAVSSPLESKFSIPYLTAFVLSRGRPPTFTDLQRVDADAAALVPTVTVVEDPGLPQSTAVLQIDGVEVRCDAALGSPARPMSAQQHEDKVDSLGASQVVGLLDRPGTPAMSVVAVLIERVGLD